jgi:hypothetical protein
MWPVIHGIWFDPVMAVWRGHDLRKSGAVTIRRFIFPYRKNGPRLNRIHGFCIVKRI